MKMIVSVKGSNNPENHREMVKRITAEMRKARVPERDVQVAVRNYWKEVKA